MDIDRQKYIKGLAENINSISEKYQITHAAFAIEQMLREKKLEQQDKEIKELIKELAQTTDKERTTELIETIKNMRKEYNPNFRIEILYDPFLKGENARLHRTKNDTFRIAIPKCMECIRNPKDNTIDIDGLERLRRVMAHELGHIILHSGILDSSNVPSEDCEEEANYFADCLIGLRKIYSAEIGEVKQLPQL